MEKAIEEVIGYFGKIDILLNNAGVAIRGGVIYVWKIGTWEWM